MKVKPTSYHSQQSAAKPQNQAIHQPVLSSQIGGVNNAHGSGPHSMYPKDKSKSFKSGGGSTKATGGQGNTHQQNFLSATGQGHGQEATPSGKNHLKTVNLSFAGQDFQHRHMSMSMHNGFYVNQGAMDDASRKHQIVHHNKGNIYQGGGGQQQSAHQQQTILQQPSSQLNNNTTSVRSLGMGGGHHQQRPQQLQQQAQQVGAHHHHPHHQANQNFSTVQQTAFNNLHLQNTPQVKKNVSSKNQQRRKISATNQSAQFQSNASQFLQGAAGAPINYAHTIKKKSSKANMLLESQQVAHVNPFPGNNAAIQGANTSIPRQITQKHSQQSYQGRGGYTDMQVEDLSPNDSTQVFDGRLTNLNRAQQSSVQSHQHGGNPDNSSSNNNNIFYVQQQMSSNGPGGQPQIDMRQVVGVQTPSGFKQVAMVSAAPGQDGLAFTENGQKILAAQGLIGSSSVRAKTMVPITGSHLGSIGAAHQQQNSGQVPMSVHQSAKMNKNYLKAAPQQYEISHQVNGSNYSKSQQRSFQSLQAQHMQFGQASHLHPMQMSQQTAQSSGSGAHQNPQLVQVTSQMATSPSPSQQSFVYGRKLVDVKQGSAMTYLTQAQANGGGGLEPMMIQRTTSVQPQFEFEGNIVQLDQLQLQKINSQQLSAVSNKQQIILNQAQIQYASRDPASGVGGNDGQAQNVISGATSQQSAQKNTNLIVRIDNSSAGNHQIIKRKRLKENGTTLRNGQVVMEPSDTDQASEAGGQQMGPIGVENVDHLPVFIASVGDSTALKDMSNSQQHFNSKGPLTSIVPGKASGNTAAEEGEALGRGLVGPRNEGVIRHSSKPGSALVDKRGGSLQRPDSKQGSLQVPQVRLISAKKKFDQELAARDALIGIDDEDEMVAHHQDFSENDGESQMSAGDISHDELQLNYNKSVDSDKVGKSGSLSYRQSVKPIAAQQLAAAPGGAQPIQMHQTVLNGQGESDIESEKSGGQSHMFVYSGVPGGPQQMAGSTSYNVLASDSETDGNFSDTGSHFGRGTTLREDGGREDVRPDIDGISEHSSDEADSDSEEVQPDGKKKEKIQGEKPIKKKKKKNQDEKATTMKKTSKGDKDAAAATTKNKKEKSNNAAPTKKNFAETKEKEYTGKSNKQHKEAPKSKIQVAKENAKGGDKSDKPNVKVQKTANEQAQKPKKPKEESKSAAADPLKESPTKKKNKQKLNLALVHTQPKNIEEQRQVFFESDCTVNPVFEYENYVATQKFLAQFKEPSEEFLELSKKILESFIMIYGTESAYLETEGEIVSREETVTAFTDYLEELEFEDLLTVQFKQNQVAPTSVTHDPKTCKSRVNIRDPPEYRRGRLYGVIDHEIGTHFMRKFNERFQAWHKKRDKFELKSCIQTEEGFACVNQLVRTAWEGKHPFLYRSALNYYAAFMASKLSFVELFNDIGKYIDNRLARWRFTLRLKRGLIETSEPGGLYKDQCYLEGAVMFLQNRHEIDIIGLFTGKISLEDLAKPKIQKVLNKESIKLPPFMKDMERYMAALDIIAKTNHIPAKAAE